MSNIWYEENIYPDINSLATKDMSKSPIDVSGIVRLHVPRWKLLTHQELHQMAVPNLNNKYILVRLGCEFDLDQHSKAFKNHFESAVFQVFLHPDKDTKPRVYSLAPAEMDKGSSKNIKLKLEPSITFASGAGGSIGGVEQDITIGQVAPIIRGFKGKDEMQPYWNLQNHSESPLYGIRNFWLILETPLSVQGCYLSCRAEARLNTLLGNILLLPQKSIKEHRPRLRIEFAEND